MPTSPRVIAIATKPINNASSTESTDGKAATSVRTGFPLPGKGEGEGEGRASPTGGTQHGAADRGLVEARPFKLAAHDAAVENIDPVTQRQHLIQIQGNKHHAATR